MSREIHDQLTLRCPRLGGAVTFEYCRKAGAPFCRSIIACWAVRLDIGQYLADHYTAEEIQAGLELPAQSKVQRMIELTENAQKQVKPD
jgi:hypothetical protein